MPSPEATSNTQFTHSSSSSSSSSGGKLSSHEELAAAAAAGVRRVCAERPAGGLFLPQPAATGERIGR
jgi:hypothetical protein